MGCKENSGTMVKFSFKVNGSNSYLHYNQGVSENFRLWHTGNGNNYRINFKDNDTVT